jgi:hypothetical protein
MTTDIQIGTTDWPIMRQAIRDTQATAHLYYAMLADVRDRRLYLKDFKTFEEYCRHDLGYSGDYIRKLIRSNTTRLAITATSVSEQECGQLRDHGLDASPSQEPPASAGVQVPTNERQLREIRKAPEHLQTAAIKRGQEIASEAGRKPTAKDYAKAVAEVGGVKPKAAQPKKVKAELLPAETTSVAPEPESPVAPAGPPKPKGSRLIFRPDVDMDDGVVRCHDGRPVESQKMRDGSYPRNAAMREYFQDYKQNEVPRHLYPVWRHARNIRTLASRAGNEPIVDVVEALREIGTELSRPSMMDAAKEVLRLLDQIRQVINGCFPTLVNGDDYLTEAEARAEGRFP